MIETVATCGHRFFFRVMICGFEGGRDPIVCVFSTFERSLGHLREQRWSPGIIGTRGIPGGFAGFAGAANKLERNAWNLFRHQRKSLRLRSARRWFIFREYAILNMFCCLFDFAFSAVCDQNKNWLFFSFEFDKPKEILMHGRMQCNLKRAGLLIHVVVERDSPDMRSRHAVCGICHVRLHVRRTCNCF